jgi:PIN domain nuclease of toxin-antitoxin system
MFSRVGTYVISAYMGKERRTTAMKDRALHAVNEDIDPDPSRPLLSYLTKPILIGLVGLLAASLSVLATVVIWFVIRWMGQKDIADAELQADMRVQQSMAAVQTVAIAGIQGELADLSSAVKAQHADMLAFYKGVALDRGQIILAAEMDKRAKKLEGKK